MATTLLPTAPGFLDVISSSYWDPWQGMWRKWWSISPLSPSSVSGRKLGETEACLYLICPAGLLLWMRDLIGGHDLWLREAGRPALPNSPWGTGYVTLSLRPQVGWAEVRVGL